MGNFNTSFYSISRIAVASTILFLPLATFAQDSTTDIPNPGSRFQIERDGDGFVRLDSKTGETSYCRSTNGKLVCRLAVEERDTFHNEISDLQGKLRAAEEKLNAEDETEHSLLRPKDDVPDTDHDEDAGSENDKFEKELDRAMEITKFAVRRLFKTVKELQKEFGE
jgi:hypothetical protein